LIICTFLAVIAAWARDHNHLRSQLLQSEVARAEEKRESQKIADELVSRNHRHARSRREFDEKQNGPYERLPETHPVYSAHPDAILKLNDLGVKLYVNRRDEVVLANVPDTTNFKEVFSELQNFPTLVFVYFTTGPLLDGNDWGTAEFRRAYADACARPIMRTFATSDQFRRDAYAELRRQLPQIEATEWVGAF